MKKSLVVCMAAMLVLAASCKKNEEKDGKLGFRASLETPTGDSKTHMDGLNVKWDAGNTILVINGNNEAETFTTQGGEAAGNYADFTGTEEESFFTPNYTAYYPSTLLQDGKVSLSETLAYEAGTFADGANPMAAQSTDEKLEFMNLCGILDIPLKGTCQVTSISITSNNEEEMLWGKADLTMNGHDGDMEPSLSNWTDGSNTVTLNCGNAQLNDAATHFYIVLPAGSLASGFKMTVTCSDGTTMTLKGTSNTEIEQSRIRTMAEVPVTPEEPVVPTVTNWAGCDGCVYDVANYKMKGTYTIKGNVAIAATTTHECEYGFVFAPVSLGVEPTIDNPDCIKVSLNSEVISAGSKDFSMDLAGLEFVEGAKYKVRAYGNCDQVAYGENSILFVYSTLDPVAWPSGWVPDGHSDYAYSISATQQVYFSRGNLQYLGSGSNTWKFAEHQFDFLGWGAQHNSDASNVIRDLFGWGTSGYNHNGKCYQPWSTDESEPNYWPYNSPTSDLYSDNGKADWGVNNTICGSNWRTLKKDEWVYLLSRDGLYGLGKINNCIPGIIILPDNWSLPTGLSFEAGVDAVKGYDANLYSYQQWSLMEQAGAIFLPAAGWRSGKRVKDSWSKLYYWSSTRTPVEYQAFEVDVKFENGGYRLDRGGTSSLYAGFSVRLVQDK